MRLFKTLATVATFALFTHTASAALITADSYDAYNVRLSGTGGWVHTYNGTISSNGSTYNYTNGSGTLNDGLVGTGLSDTQLFQVADNSSIDLLFDSLFSFSELSLYSYGPTTNGIPGSISGVNVTINGITAFISSQGFGPSNAGSSNNGRDHSHELIDLSNTALFGLVSNKVTLSGFVTEGNYAQYYAISEVTLDATASSSNVSAVSEPSAMALMLLSLLTLVRLRKNTSK